ncbi:unnamed protein product, partial [Ectocarpus sp. 6 AP-2014]
MLVHASHYPAGLIPTGISTTIPGTSQGPHPAIKLQGRLVRGGQELALRACTSPLGKYEHTEPSNQQHTRTPPPRGRLTHIHYHEHLHHHRLKHEHTHTLNPATTQEVPPCCRFDTSRYATPARAWTPPCRLRHNTLNPAINLPGHRLGALRYASRWSWTILLWPSRRTRTPNPATQVPGYLRLTRACKTTMDMDMDNTMGAKTNTSRLNTSDKNRQPPSLLDAYSDASLRLCRTNKGRGWRTGPKRFPSPPARLHRIRRI